MKVQLESLNKLKKQQLNGVVYVSKTTKSGKPSLKLDGVPKDYHEVIEEAFSERSFEANENEFAYFRHFNTDLFKHVLVMGLGESKKIDYETLRSAAGATYKFLKSKKMPSMAIMTDSLLAHVKDATLGVQAFVEGAQLVDYYYDEHMSNKSETVEPKNLTLLLGKKGTSASLKKAIETAMTIADGVNYAKWLGDVPGNLMYPETLVKSIQKECKNTKIKVSAWDRARIKKEGFGGLYGVALGSTREPRFIIMEYKGAAASKKHLALVGKGLTFDSGGISIKPSPSMDEMKYDMCGGANVIGAMLAIAKLKMKVNVTAYIPASENMPGPIANKPGDILKFRNGMTCHVDNTDAEGRLILADALSYACEKKPAAVVDVATLTGAVLVALGNSYSGIMGRDNRLTDKLKDAANKADEKVWQLPMDETHIGDMKGTYADLNNIGPGRLAGTSRAAAFLSHFVDKDIPWVHCDIAGTAWDCSKRLTYVPTKGATGVLVRTFVELAKKF